MNDKLSTPVVPSKVPDGDWQRRYMIYILSDPWFTDTKSYPRGFEAVNVKVSGEGTLECTKLEDENGKPAKVIYNGKFYIEEITNG